MLMLRTSGFVDDVMFAHNRTGKVNASVASTGDVECIIAYNSNVSNALCVR